MLSYLALVMNIIVNIIIATIIISINIFIAVVVYGLIAYCCYVVRCLTLYSL